jgi:hypothetical protein
MRRMWMHRMLVVALVVGGTAGSIGAQSITGWRTPAGKLYFGDNPPRGSRQIGTTYTPPPMGTASSDDVASAPPPSPSTRTPTDTASEPPDRDARGTWAGMTEAHQGGKRPQDPPPGWR